MKNRNNWQSKVIGIAKEIIPSDDVKITSLRKCGSDAYFVLAEDERYSYKVEFLLTQNFYGYKLLLFDYEEKPLKRPAKRERSK